MDKLQECMHSFLLSLVLSLSNCKRQPLFSSPPRWSHVCHQLLAAVGEAALSLTCCFSPGGQWVPGFLLSSVAVESLQASAHYIAHPSPLCLELHMWETHAGLLFC